MTERLHIEWLDPAEFYARFEHEYQPRGLCLQFEISFSSTREGLARVVPADPVEDPTEQDEPGPCVRWYGHVADALFWLTHYDHPYWDLALLTTRGKTAEEPYRWSVLTSLMQLPDPILRNITSLSWTPTRAEAAQARATPRTTPTAAVAFIDEHLIMREVLVTETPQEAEAVCTLLTRIGSNYEYYVTEPEPGDTDWIVFKQVPGEAELCVARYPWRSSAEEVARTMSLQDEYIYRAQEVGARGRRGMSFRQGKAVAPENLPRT